MVGYARLLFCHTSNNIWIVPLTAATILVFKLLASIYCINGHANKSVKPVREAIVYEMYDSHIE